MNELNWIKQEFSLSSLESQEIQHILNFGLVWNIFENLLCKKDASISQSSDLANEYNEKINQTISNDVFKHFQDRYIENGAETSNFTNFEFKNNAIKTSVRDVLIKSSSTTKEKLEALLKIIFRLRNNLLHGEKDIQTIPSQNENFKYANMLLMEIIQKRIQVQGTTR